MFKCFLGNMNSRINHAYCPPDGEFGTIEAYVWNCHPGPSGEPRGKVPYYSNPNAQVDGVATGSQTENNAKYMTDNRFASASAGTNCLDGHPDGCLETADPESEMKNELCANICYAKLAF